MKQFILKSVRKIVVWMYYRTNSWIGSSYLNSYIKTERLPECIKVVKSLRRKWSSDDPELMRIECVVSHLAYRLDRYEEYRQLMYGTDNDIQN